MSTIDSTARVRILTDVLDAWANGIREHEPEVVASYFTENALFQTSSPWVSVPHSGSWNTGSSPMTRSSPMSKSTSPALTAASYQSA
jgi:hypothetical protein